MELTTLQIDLFKSLAGLLLTGGVMFAAGYAVKTLVDKLPEDLLKRFL